MNASAFLTLKEQVAALTERQRKEIGRLLLTPREGWAKILRARATSRVDELADTRIASNQFDAKEWKW